METLIKIIVIAAIIGAFWAYFAGDKKTEDAAAGAAAGAMFAGSCLFQLFIYGLMIVGALWVVSLVFR